MHMTLLLAVNLTLSLSYIHLCFLPPPSGIMYCLPYSGTF
jgi:hypothetical protein